MKTTYTVTGTSTIRPTGLPAGLKVEAKTEKFDKTIGAHSDGDRFKVRVEETYDGEINLSLLEGTSAKYGSAMYVDKPQVVKLRDTLNEYLGDKPAAETSIKDRVVGLVRAGKKIQAIKEYRELTGADLYTAKVKVEQFADPFPFTRITPIW